MISLRSSVKNASVILPNILHQQSRNTFILKRRHPLPLHAQDVETYDHRKWKAKNFIYDLVKDTNIIKRPDIKIILTQFVEGHGNAGDVLTLRPGRAYRDFLLPGRAVYANPENLIKYKVDESKPKDEFQYSSPYVQKMLNLLAGHVCVIIMNRDNPWTLEPWHVRTAFRRCRLIVPEYAITMPPVTISGPDPLLDEKEFFVTIKINNRETVNVRCRIHQWANDPSERTQLAKYHFEIPKEPLIPEQAEILASMPLPIAKKKKLCK